MHGLWCIIKVKDHFIDALSRTEYFLPQCVGFEGFDLLDLDLTAGLTHAGILRMLGGARDAHLQINVQSSPFYM